MNDEIKSLLAQIEELNAKLSEARRRTPPEPVKDYTLKTPDGKDVKLSELFAGKRDLLLVHNMGRKCPYCTLWADGLVGYTKHLQNRAGFALCSPDEPAVLKEFAAGRGWNFPCVSSHGSRMAYDLGFRHDKDGKAFDWPGVSALHKHEDGSMVRNNFAHFGPGDAFCSAWHLFDLLKDGPAGWEPKYAYA